MAGKILYSNNSIKIREAVDKANAILHYAAFYEVIRSRHQPFSQSSPADLSPTEVADELEKNTYNPFLREMKTLATISGRFRSKFPLVIWVNISAIGRHTAEALAAMLVHQYVLLVAMNNPQNKFGYDQSHIGQNIDTAPYWIQQIVREKFVDIPSEKLSTQYLLEVDIKNAMSQ